MKNVQTTLRVETAILGQAVNMLGLPVTYLKIKNVNTILLTNLIRENLVWKNCIISWKK